ncbi:MAG TPA: hypothetical protein PLQ03_04555 [Brevundimonas sp.]|uniref:hypothetical protein n=1 Tax=Brevundimonas sp. TaxID=1871086 RepID=UPI002613AD78|nr:hypothetical protein [Brevundimonas sp.]HRO32665.1 hypothetical protein [Brevundimonas sp.]
MIRRLFLVLAALCAAIAAPMPAAAQPTRTLDAFVADANRIPMNATAMLRPSARRLMTEASTAMGAVVEEARTAQAAGRPNGACPPEKIQVNAQQVLRFLNAIPQPRRARMSVRDGFRAWLVDGYPCRA